MTQTVIENLTNQAATWELHNADGHDIGAAGEAQALREAVAMIEAGDIAGIAAAERIAQQHLDYDIDTRWNSGRRAGFRTARKALAA